MKKLFKKAVTVLGSFAMIGATMAGAMATTYQDPFGDDSAVVVGSTAAASDTAAAMLVASDLGIKALADSTTTTVEGGDSVHLGDLFGDMVLGGNIGGTIYDDDLSLLEDGVVNSVDYSQMLVLEADVISYGSLSDEDNYVVNADVAEELKPVLYVNQASGAAWTYTLTFDEDFNATDAGNEKIVLAGKEYTIDPNLGTTGDLVLYASSNTVEVTYGESKTVEVAGKSFVIEVTGGRDSDDPEATVKINDKTSRVNAGDTITVESEDFYINEVFMNTFGDTNTMSVEVFVGAEKLTIDNSTTTEVELGDDVIDSVVGYYTNNDDDTSLEDLETIVLKFTPADADYDYDAEYQEYSYLEMGESVTDPVLGTFSIFFESASQDLTEDKEMIEVKQSGDELKITFTNVAGTEYSFSPLKNSDYNILHNETAFASLDREDRKEKFVLNKDGTATDVSHIAEITSVELSGSDIASVTFAYDGTTESVNIGDPMRRSADNLYVCYGLNTSKIDDMEYNGTDDAILVELEDKTSFSIQEGSCVYDYTVDGTDSGITDNDTTRANATAQVVAQLYDGSLDAIYAINDVTIDISRLAEASDDTADSQDSGDVYLIETSSSDNNLIFDVAFNGATDDEYVITYNKSGASGAEDTDGEMAYYLSNYGTYMELEAEDDTWLKAYVPAEEVTYNVYVTTGEVSTPTTSTGAKTVKDTETSAYANKNIVVVGGSAVNTVAAQLLGLSGDARYGEGFTAATGVGADQFMIEAFDYATDKVALLVAGYEAADTTKAVTYLLGDNDVSTTVGEGHVYSTTTLETVA